MFRQPTLYLPDLARDAAADVDRDHRGRVEPDAPAVEQGRRDATCWRSSRRPGRWSDRRAPKSKMPRPFEEELALLRKQQAEPRQVHLLLVHFDLREVGVHRDVRGQVRGDAVLHVDAGVALPTSFDTAGVRSTSVVTLRDAVRLQLDVLARRRQVEADQRRRRARRGRCPPGTPVDAGTGVRCVHSFLRRIDAPELDAPGLVRARTM